MICYDLLQFPHFLEGIETRARGLELFGDCLVLLLEKNDSIMYLQQSIDKVVQNHGGEPNDFGDWEPHITLCKSLIIPECDIMDENIQLESLKFWVEQEKNKYESIFIRPLY